MKTVKKSMVPNTLSEHQMPSIAQALSNLLNINPDGKELIGFIGDGLEPSNFVAITNWLKGESICNILNEPLDKRQVQKMALKLVEEIQDFYSLGGFE